MLNPFEPTLSPPTTKPTTAPQNPPEFLPPSAFRPSEWPTWSSIEPSMQALIANTHSSNSNFNSTNTYTTTNSSASLHHRPTTLIGPAAPLRKRRLSKPADGQQQNEQAHFLGEDFGVNEVVEALRGKVEVERVFGRLMEWRREFWSMGRLQEGGAGDGGGSGKGEGEEAMRA